MPPNYYLVRYYKTWQDRGRPYSRVLTIGPEISEERVEGFLTFLERTLPSVGEIKSVIHKLPTEDVTIYRKERNSHEHGT